MAELSGQVKSLEYSLTHNKVWVWLVCTAPWCAAGTLQVWCAEQRTLPLWACPQEQVSKLSEERDVLGREVAQLRTDLEATRVERNRLLEEHARATQEVERIRRVAGVCGTLARDPLVAPAVTGGWPPTHAAPRAGPWAVRAWRRSRR